MRAHDVRSVGAGFLAQPERERRARPVDQTVDERRGRDLAAQCVGADPVEEPFSHRVGKGPHQLGHEVGVVRKLRREQLFFERDLRVREQHRQFRRGEAQPEVVPLGKLFVRGEALEISVEMPARFQRVHEPRVHLIHHDGPGARIVERAVLAVVVAQYERRDLVGHADEQHIAIDLAQFAFAYRAVEQNFDVHLVVGGVDARAVVDRIGVDTTARERVLDPAVLGETEVASLGDASAPQIVAVDPHRVVRLVLDRGVGLGARLDVGADAAVVEQVDRRPQDCADDLGRGECVDAVFDREPRAQLGRDRDRLQRARVHPAACGDVCGVVVGPRRTRPLEQPASFCERLGRIRVGIEEQVPVIERGDELDVLRQQHRVTEHVARHVADADHGEVVVIGIDLQVAEVAPHRLPRTPRRDAHRLVVVTVLAARRERVAQPEAASARDLVGNVGEGRGALVGGDHQIGIVVVVADHLIRRYDLAVDEVVGDVEQRPDEQAVASLDLFA